MIEYSDDLNSVSCQKSVMKPCWNFERCGRKVLVPCKTLAKTVQCETHTEWTCSRGHPISLKLSRTGTPPDCPLCSSMLLDAAITDTQRMLSSNSWIPEATLYLSEVSGMTYIEMSFASKRDFLIRKINCLKSSRKGWIVKHYRPTPYSLLWKSPCLSCWIESCKRDVLTNSR